MEVSENEDISELTETVIDTPKTEVVPVPQSKDVLTIEDNILKYTPHLSENDIKAFVWYNRSLGLPMTG